jgi:Uri superfamily endonuclease
MKRRYAAILGAIPKAKGSYALRLRLAAEITLKIGRLGSHEFSAGDYVYLGSALGPGGLRGRLARHLRAGGKAHWHIDFLRKPAHVVELGFETATAESLDAIKLECRWSQALTGVQGIHIPMHAFGASDCHSGCAAHLVALPTQPFKSLQDWFIRAGIHTHSMNFITLDAY